MIGIINYNAGNTGSWKRLLRYLDKKYIIIENPTDLNYCRKIILPGVGAFDAAVESLQKLNLFDPIISEVKNGKKILGVCLGMQLLFEKSSEGNLKGLGLLKSTVKKFSEISKKNIKMPHVGFNRVSAELENSSDFLNIANDNDFYFVHSYLVENDSNNEFKKLLCNYENIVFVAGLEKGNIFATQFHPEKSQINGLKILKNFLRNF